MNQYALNILLDPKSNTYFFIPSFTRNDLRLFIFHVETNCVIADMFRLAQRDVKFSPKDLWNEVRWSCYTWSSFLGTKNLWVHATSIGRTISIKYIHRFIQNMYFPNIEVWSSVLYAILKMLLIFYYNIESGGRHIGF